MPWLYQSSDNRVEVIVEPDFRGDLLALASVRPVWIVDTSLNSPHIDAVWAIGADMNLFEVSRCRCQAGDQRLENLFDILGSLDDHHQHHDIVVHGLAPTELQTAPDEQGVRIVETTPDGFAAAQIPEVRDRFIGRF